MTARRTDIVCHLAGGILLSIVVMEKASYGYVWIIFGFFSVPPLVFELAGILNVTLLKKRRW